MKVYYSNQEYDSIEYSNRTTKKFKLAVKGKRLYEGGLAANYMIPAGNYAVHNIVVGRCSYIGRNVELIVDQTHDYKSVFQGVIPELARMDNSKHAIGQMVDRITRKGQIIVGSDCTIGDDVTILAGVQIGDGAIVESNSVVVKDVPAYAVAKGNPAKVIGYQFSPDVIKKLETIQWWMWPDEEIKEKVLTFEGTEEEFAELYYPVSTKYEIKTGTIIPKVKEGIKRFVYFVDAKEDYLTFPNVVTSFSQAFHREDAELIILYHEDALDEMKHMLTITTEIERHPEINSIINICAIPYDMDELIMTEADYYLPNRSLETLDRISYANKYGVKIISAVDRPLFSDSFVKEIKENI